MSADRRVLAIAAIAMVVFVSIGVVSAQVFTASACDDIVPEPIDARMAGTDLGRILAAGLPDLDDDARAALRSALDALTARLGSVVAAADVRGAERLSEVAEGVAAVGPVTTVLGPSLREVRATAEVDAAVQGAGAALWSLAMVDDATGQVDALLPLSADLEAGTCLDTATVGTPFAFVLDAGRGELLLFRIDEDADTPQLELRDPVQGRAWAVDLDLPTAPPGVHAERLGGLLGDDLVVLGRRAVADDGADAPVVSAYARVDGTERWRVGLGDLESAAPGGEEPLWVRPLAANEDTVVVALSREDASGRATFVALDAADGRPRWVAGLDGPRQANAAELSRDELMLAVREDVLTVYAVELEDGEAHPRVGIAGDRVAIEVLDDGRTLVAVDGNLTVVGDTPADTVNADVWFADLAVQEDVVVVLLRSDEGAVAVGFGADGADG